MSFLNFCSFPTFRAHFALQLLEMAKFFTSNPLGLALYPTGSATVFIFFSFTEFTAKYSCTSLLKIYIYIVIARISDMARISAIFGLFYVLWRYFELRHYFNDVKVAKNSQDQCEFEYLFIF
jgi:hypothetical protein